MDQHCSLTVSKSHLNELAQLDHVDSFYQEQWQPLRALRSITELPDIAPQFFKQTMKKRFLQLLV